jgi:DNA-binding NtrC family response regulator
MSAAFTERKRRWTMKPTILIVDDERDFAEILKERLKGKGYAVQQCCSGREALKEIRNGGIDIVVLDVVMPEMDGISVLNEIQSMRSQVEVIMLSGKAGRKEAIAGILRGAFHHLEKPCKDGDLTKEIENAYRRKQEKMQRMKSAMERVRKASRKRQISAGRNGVS